MAVNAADAWQHSGARADRPSRGSRGTGAERARAGAPRSRSTDRGYYGEPSRYTRPPVPRREPEDSRPVNLSEDWEHPVDRYSQPVERGSARAGRRPATGAAATGGGRVRGILAVLGIFLVTLAGAGLDSFIGTGLGTITLIALVASTAVGTFLVRRRDLLSVVVSPPLVFVAVAGVNIVAAPSVHLTTKTIALVMGSLLVQGFPAMAVSTGAGIVVALLRLAAKR